MLWFLCRSTRVRVCMCVLGYVCLCACVCMCELGKSPVTGHKSTNPLMCVITKSPASQQPMTATKKWAPFMPHKFKQTICTQAQSYKLHKATTCTRAQSHAHLLKSLYSCFARERSCSDAACRTDHSRSKCSSSELRCSTRSCQSTAHHSCERMSCVLSNYEMLHTVLSKHSASLLWTHVMCAE